MLLELGGHGVQVAFDGPRAVEFAAEIQPQVIILDIGLPKMDGYEVARQIRKQPGGKDVFIVALTGLGQEKDRRLSKEAGYDAHLVKPVEPSALSTILADLTVLR
jgi:CheY-like chemotaxis protein